MMRVVVIGGVAAGPKAAAKVMRLRPDADVTVVEKGEFLSYAGCGLPYYISGEVREQAELMSTAIGVVRDAKYFRDCKGVNVLNRTEAMRIDRRRGRVEVKDLGNGSTRWLEYEKLVLATGAHPVVPPVPGKELRNVFVVHHVEDAEAIRTAIAEIDVRNVVVVGGGLIGVEVAEALSQRGAHVAIVEMLPQVLPMLDWEMARQVEKHLIEKGAGAGRRHCGRERENGARNAAGGSRHSGDWRSSQYTTRRGRRPGDRFDWRDPSGRPHADLRPGHLCGW